MSPAAPDENTDDKELRAGPVARFIFLDPTFAILLAVLLTVGGGFAATVLVKESLPDLDIPQATISTEWPGGDPQTIEQDVTEPIETEVRSIQGVKSVTSASFDSFSIIAVEFFADADPNESMSLLRARVNDAEAELPDEADTPRIEQVSVDDRPIISIALFGEVEDAVLSRFAKDLQDELERIQGVNEVDLAGSRDEVIQILLKPDRLLSLGISPTRVRDAVQAANIDMPWGAIEGAQLGARVRLTGKFQTVEDLQRLPVTRLGPEGNQRLVRLGDIAEVRRQLEQETSRAAFSWEGAPYQSSVEVSVKKVPGGDTVAVVGRVRQALEEARAGAEWPEALDYRVTQDEAEQIWNSLTDVLNNGWQAMLAVFVILFLVLTWREGVIAGLSVPLTFLAALVGIWLMGYTLNELVIIGMVLALGLLVDVFILMMEGMHESIFNEKKSFSQAALSTVRRYALPAAAGQMTTILALLPLAAISGTAGKFIRVLPVTAIVCLVAAYAIALLAAIPLSRFLLGRVSQKSGDSRQSTADRISSRASEKLLHWSRRSTLRSRKSAFVWVVGVVLIFVLGVVAFTRVPVTMYPDSDGLKLGVTIVLPPSTTLEQSQEVADSVGEIMREKPYLESVVKLTGRKSPMAQRSITDSLQPTEGEHFVGFSGVFKERGARELPSYTYADQLRAEIQQFLNDHVAGARLTVASETGGPNTGEPIEIDILGDELDTLIEISDQVQAALSRVSGAVGVRDNLGALEAEIALRPQREAIDFYGITQSDLASQVRYAMGNDPIGSFPTSGLEDDLDIQLGMDWPSRGQGGGGPRRLTELSFIRAFTPEGETVPLLSLLEARQDLTPVSITHQDGRRAVSVLASNEGRPVNAIVEEFVPQLNEMRNDWPAGFDYSIGGETEETAETFGSAGIMLVIAIILVFAVLVLVFGSFVQSLIILATMPLAMIGTFYGFFVFGIPMSFFAVVGIIALIGIVVNNAIVMVDTMNTYLQQGVGIDESAARGAADRLRPVISTSLTTVVGLIPLAITNPMWRPLCFAIMFGLISSTFLSLVIVPCLYLLLTRKRQQEALTSAHEVK